MDEQTIQGLYEANAGLRADAAYVRGVADALKAMTGLQTGEACRDAVIALLNNAA